MDVFSGFVVPLMEHIRDQLSLMCAKPRSSKIHGCELVAQNLSFASALEFIMLILGLHMPMLIALVYIILISISNLSAGFCWQF